MRLVVDRRIPFRLSDHKKASSLGDRIRGRVATKFPNYERRRPPSGRSIFRERAKLAKSSIGAKPFPKLQPLKTARQLLLVQVA